MTVVVKKIGGSMAVVIPKALARQMEIGEGTALEISGSGQSIHLRKRKRRARRPIADIVAEMNPAAYRRRRVEFPDSGPVGKEYW